MLFSPFILSTILQKYALDIYLTDEKNDAYTYETCSHSYTSRTKREARFVPRVFFFFNWIHDVIHFSLVNSPSILNELKNGKIQAIFP